MKTLDSIKITMAILYTEFEFTALAERVVAASENEVTYVVESEVLTGYIIKENREKIRDAIELQHRILEIEELNEVSQDVIRLNLARLFYLAGDQRGAGDELQKIKHKDNLVVKLKLEKLSRSSDLQKGLAPAS